MKTRLIGKHFHHYKYMGANFRHSRTSNTEVNSLIWPKFELIREFLADLATCKFDEDPIKIEGTIDRTRSNVGFFGSQGQVTLKWKVCKFIREFLAVLVTCKFDEDPIKIKCTIDRAGRGTSSGSVFAWHASGPEFDPHVRHFLSWRLGHETFLRPFSLFCWFKKSSCQLLTKECALRLVNCLGGMLG